MNKIYPRALFGFAIMLAGLLSLAACSDTRSSADISASDTVRAVYAGFAAGDMDMVTSVMSSDIIWNEAKGHPYADKNPYIGPKIVLSDLFSRIGGEWTDFTATPDEFVAMGNRIVVFGRYVGTYNATQQTLDAPFVHSWTLSDGKIIEFQQYTDTAQYVAIMTK